MDSRSRMPSKRSLLLALEADDDVVSILQYTYEAWGPEKQAEYSTLLSRAFSRLIDFPESGSVDVVAPPLRWLPVGEHMIYYIFDDTSVQIIRVLHQRMSVRS